MTANEWNSAHDVGTSVTYTPVKGMPETIRAITRSKAWTLGHGVAVVKITGALEAGGDRCAGEGISGGVSLDHLTVTG